VYAGRVAEHAVALLLAAARRLGVAARRATWGGVRPEPLDGASVGVFGAGAIGEELFRRLAPFGVRRLALTRSGRSVAGADASFSPDALDELLRASDYLVLAAPLTSETDGVIDARALELLGPEAWLVNVGRGRLVQTDALCGALEAGHIGGACLDVTDPEPLPDGHPLWSFENVLITPHVANPWHRHEELLATRVAENVRRFIAGADLLGAIDLDHGY
jgi:D-3-phosphoglycerate dehydrogenase